MSSNILDPSAIVSRLPDLLPSDAPTLQSPQDALAALIHTIHAILGFRLIAVDEASPSHESPDNHLPQGWNAKGPSDYTFRYRHEQSSLVFLIRIVKMAAKSLINAISVETEKVVTLDILTADYLSLAFFPYEKGSLNPLVHGFISSNRVQDLVTLYKIKVVQQLIPGLRKEGYEESSTSTESSSNASTSNRIPQGPARSNRPQTPPYSDNEPFRLPHPTDRRNPLSIGRQDLDPIPMHPNPFSPPPLFDPAGGGMFVGPNHPLFQGGIGGRPGRSGPWGGDGFLPPMGAPTGARFDPVGPRVGFGGPGGLPGGPGGRTGGRIGGDPDNDEFFPPGNPSDMYM